MNQKGSVPVLLLIVAGIVLVGSGYYFYSHQNVPTSKSVTQPSNAPSPYLIKKDKSLTHVITNVSNYSEVKDFLNQSKYEKISVEKEDDIGWWVRVYEEFSDHEETFGWYYVRKSDGYVIPSSDPDMSTWKIYQNTKVGFELKYPSSYQITYGACCEYQLATGVEDDTRLFITTKQPSSYDMNIEVFPFSGDVDALLKSGKAVISDSEREGNLFKELTKKEVVINDRKWYWVGVFIEGAGGYNYAITFANNHAFVFQPEGDYDSDEVDQILSTFKFTD